MRMLLVFTALVFAVETSQADDSSLHVHVFDRSVSTQEFRKPGTVVHDYSEPTRRAEIFKRAGLAADRFEKWDLVDVQDLLDLAARKTEVDFQKETFEQAIQPQELSRIWKALRDLK